MERTFREIHPVLVDGSETGTFPVDLGRHQNVMTAIAYALYLHDYGEKHRGGWRIFTPSFRYAGTVRYGRPDPWQDLRRQLESSQFRAMPVSEPEVSKYGLIELEQGQLIYRFEFYGSVVVNAWTIFQAYISW